MPNETKSAARYITPETLAMQTGVSGGTARRALRRCARRLGYRRDARTWWKLDAERADDRALIEAARAFLNGSARHGLSRRSRGQLAGK